MNLYVLFLEEVCVCMNGASVPPGFLGPAVCLGGVMWAGCDSLLSVLFLTLAMGFNGATYSGYMVTHVDMAPDYAGNPP